MSRYAGVKAQIVAGWEELKGFDPGPDETMPPTIRARLKAVEREAELFRQSVSDLVTEPERIKEREERDRKVREKEAKAG